MGNNSAMVCWCYSKMVLGGMFMQYNGPQWNVYMIQWSSMESLCDTMILGGMFMWYNGPQWNVYVIQWSSVESLCDTMVLSGIFMWYNGPQWNLYVIQWSSVECLCGTVVLSGIFTCVTAVRSVCTSWPLHVGWGFSCHYIWCPLHRAHKVVSPASESCWCRSTLTLILTHTKGITYWWINSKYVSGSLFTC